MYSTHRDSYTLAPSISDGRPYYVLMDRMRHGDVAQYCASCEVWWVDRHTHRTQCWSCSQEGKIVAAYV